MKKDRIHIIFLLILLSILLSNFISVEYVYAESIDIKNLDNYDFDINDNITNSTTSTPLSILTFIVYFVCFVVIATLAYLTTRWIGKQQKKIRLKSKYMEIVDNLQLGGENGLYIVRSPAGFLLLGTGKESVFLIEKLNDEEAELIIQAEENQIVESFSAQFNNYLNKFKWNIDHKSGGLE